jgi:nucleotide-binding universal stress UspA family protein
MAVNNIVIPTDFSEHAKRAFEHAFELACALGAKLHVLHVREESSLRIAVKEGLLTAGSTDDQVREAVEELIKKRLAQLMASVDCSKADITVETRHGDAKSLVLAYATEVDADLVVVGRRGAGFIDDIRSAVLGSVAEVLIKRSPCPVLVVRAEHTL